jgi:tagaturonate reductase
VGDKAIAVLPCELVSRNGDVLRVVISVALDRQMEAGFLHYLTHDCIWVNSLEDRIASETIEPVGAVAQPYALWTVERQERMALPCQ